MKRTQLALALLALFAAGSTQGDEKQAGGQAVGPTLTVPAPTGGAAAAGPGTAGVAAGVAAVAAAVSGGSGGADTQSHVDPPRNHRADQKAKGPHPPHSHGKGNN